MYNHEEEVASDYSRSEESRKRMRNGEKKKTKKKNEWEGTTELQRNFLKILFILGFSFYVLILIIWFQITKVQMTISMKPQPYRWAQHSKDPPQKSVLNSS